ncbi:MAG: DNA (cytosine-5-)-methyltransferase [Microbacteriaceae bacterium]
MGTVIELFAGVGGFRLGLERAGWTTVFSNQWEPSTKRQHASEVYVRNFGPDGHSNEDIAVVAKRNQTKPCIPKADLLVGGFPCQDYSVAKSKNSAKGLEGKKGVLWWEIAKIIESNKPKYVFLENVDRLLKSPATQRGRDFAIMLSTFGRLGYVVEWRVINAAEYGFPQRRKRVFIVAHKVNPYKSIAPASVISEVGVLARALPISPVAAADLTETAISEDPIDITENFATPRNESPFVDGGFYVKGKSYAARTKALSTPTTPLRSVLEPTVNVPDDYFVPGAKLKDWEYLKGSKRIERTHTGSGTTYFYSEGSMAYPDSLDSPSRTILTGEGGSTPSRFKHIIVDESGRHRRLTPIELERLNGFPDNWTQFGESDKLPDARRAFFMGNALVVGLVERVGKTLAEILE